MMELLRPVLLLLLLLIASGPTEGTRVRVSRRDAHNAQQYPALGELAGLEAFKSQVTAILTDQSWTGSPLFGDRSAAKYNPGVVQDFSLAKCEFFSSFGSSLTIESSGSRGEKRFARFGYYLGSGSLLVSSEFISIQEGRIHLSTPVKRPNARDFTTMEAFKRAASGSSDSTVELGEGGWAAGLCQNVKASQVTLISVGPVGLHLILMEEDPEDGLLKPCYMAEADTRRVVQLRRTPDGSRLRKYYLLVVETAFLKHAAKFTPQVPQRLGDMKTIIEAGYQKIQRESPPPVLLLANLQEALPQDKKFKVAAARKDDREAPTRLDLARAGTPLNCGHAEQLKSEDRIFGWGASSLHKCPYPRKMSCFDRFGTVIQQLMRSGQYATGKGGIILRSNSILFSSGLTSTLGSNESITKQDVHPDFHTKGDFRRSAKVNTGDGWAIGTQFDEKERTLTLARFGQPPLVILVFRETPSGEMELIVRVLGDDQLVELAVEGHAEGDRLCEHWLVFVAPSAVERLESITDLRADEDGFDEASEQMFQLISGKIAGKPVCKARQLFTARLRPQASTPKAIPASSSSRVTRATTKANATRSNSKRSPPLPSLPPEPQAQARYSKGTLQLLKGIQSEVYYVGHQLRSAILRPSAHWCSSRRSGVYVTEDVLIASRNLRSTENGQARLQQLIETNPPPTGVRKSLFKGRKATFRLGLDRRTGSVYVHTCGNAPLVLIRLRVNKTGGLDYKELSKVNKRRRVTSRSREPTIYAVINRNLLPHLPSLSNTLTLPNSKAELVKLASILNQHEQGLGSDDADLQEWDVRVALFPLNMPWQGAIRGDETTDSDAELGGEDGMSSGTDVDEDRH